MFFFLMLYIFKLMQGHLHTPDGTDILNSSLPILTESKI